MKNKLYLVIFLLTIFTVLTEGGKVMGQRMATESVGQGDSNSSTNFEPIYKITCEICGMAYTGKDFGVLAERVDKHIKEDHPDIYNDYLWGEHSEGGQYGDFHDDIGDPQSGYYVPIVNIDQVQDALSELGINSSFISDLRKHSDFIVGNNMILVSHIDLYISYYCHPTNLSLLEALEYGKPYLMFRSSSNYETSPGMGYVHYVVVTSNDSHSYDNYNYEYLYVFD